MAQTASSQVVPAKYWSCSRIEGQFVNVMGAWAMSPGLGPQAKAEVLKIAAHVRNKATKRLMKEVRLLQDVTAPEASTYTNAVLTRISQGKC